MARILVALLIVSGTLIGGSLGTLGKVYPIAEPDFLEEMQAKVLSSSFKESAQSKCLSYVPKSLGLCRASKPSRRSFDPSFGLNRDIKDQYGRVIYRKGHKVNPLEISPLKNTILVFDADDAAQLQWAMRQDPSAVWVLSGGNPLQTERTCSRPIYFDQMGVLSRKFQLSVVPVRIYQHEDGLIIEEEVPEE